MSQDVTSAFGAIAGAGFWFNMFQGIKELKPHFFKHNCNVCHGAGLLKCGKCNGRGLMRRTRLDARQSMVITAGSTGGGTASSYTCNFCKGKGTEECGPCQGQGWAFQNNVNDRKFQPKPVFEEFHRSQDTMLARPREQAKRHGKKKLHEKLDKMKAMEEEKQEEERRLRKERKKQKKLEKEKGKGKGKKDKDKNKS